MESYIIQLKNQKALQIIKGLEELNLIKIIKNNLETAPKKLSDKYSGKLDTGVGEQIQDYITETRNEWEKRNT